MTGLGRENLTLRCLWEAKVEVKTRLQAYKVTKLTVDSPTNLNDYQRLQFSTGPHPRHL